MIRAILFDMDGVLVDSFDGWLRLVNAAAIHFNRPPISRDEFLEVYGTVYSINSYYVIYDNIVMIYEFYAIPMYKSHFSIIFFGR